MTSVTALGPEDPDELAAQQLDADDRWGLRIKLLMEEAKQPGGHPRGRARVRQEARIKDLRRALDALEAVQAHRQALRGTCDLQGAQEMYQRGHATLNQVIDATGWPWVLVVRKPQE